jgi:hypothetical protein
MFHVGNIRAQARDVTMRVLITLILLAQITPGVFAQQSTRAEIAGRWLADARLFDKHLRAHTQPLPADLVIEENYTLHGTVGDATLTRSRPYSRTPAQLVYRIQLDRPVRAIDGLRKDHMVIIVTLGSGPTLDAEFHLKAHFGFDPTMRVGHFDAKRSD